MSAHISLPAQAFRVPGIMDVAKRDCQFVRYQDHKLWYRVHWSTPIANDPRFPGATVQEMNVFDFPIPVGDAGEGVFEPEMKAINLMRWIRKHITFLSEAKEANVDG